MNPDIPKTPRDELEARLTALLVGELPADEAFALGRAIEQDAELAKLYTRLKETIGLVRETAATSAGQSAGQAEPLKLSAARREKLLERFKTVKPKEFSQQRRHRRDRTVVASFAAVAALTAMALTSLIVTRSQKASFSAPLSKTDVSSESSVASLEPE